jgi:hypothetical protein
MQAACYVGGGIIWSSDGVRCPAILDGAFPGCWRARTKPFCLEHSLEQRTVGGFKGWRNLVLRQRQNLFFLRVVTATRLLGRY